MHSKIFLLILALVANSIATANTIGQATFRDKRNDLRIEDYEQDYLDIEKVFVSYNGLDQITFRFHVGGDIPLDTEKDTSFNVWIDLDRDNDTGTEFAGYDTSIYARRSRDRDKWMVWNRERSNVGMEYDISSTGLKIEGSVIEFSMKSDHFKDKDRFEVLFESRVKNTILDDLERVEIKLRKESF